MLATDNPPQGDLRALTREAPAGAPRHAAAAAAAVPRPPFPWKTRILLPGAILALLALLIGYTAKDALWPPRGVHVVPVVLKTGPAAGAGGGATTAPAATMSTGGPTVQAPGWVEADPYSTAVSALTDGIVKEVLALEGQPVKAGDVVARLVDDDAKLALAKAEADVALKRATLESAQRDWDNPVERTRAVAAGEGMVAETKAELQKQHADLAVEQAKLTAAKEEFDRTQASLAQHASSEIETIRARQAFEAQQATVKAVEARAAILEAQLAQRTADLAAARENLRLRIPEAKALAEAKSAVALANAARDEAALRLDRTQVRSPADGIVMQRLAEPGAKLMVGMDDPHSAQAVRLYDPKRLQVRVDVPLADAAKVGVGQAAQIVVGVLPDKTFSGKVTRIVNEADIQKNTLQVKVAIDNPSPELKPEMLARVRFAPAAMPAADHGAMPGMNHDTIASAGGQTVFAPVDLIHRMGDMSMAWVVDPARGTAVHKTIVLGDAQQGGWVAVASGLAPGDQLIADNDGLTDGQRVRVLGEANLDSHSGNTAGGRHGSH